MKFHVTLIILTVLATRKSHAEEQNATHEPIKEDSAIEKIEQSAAELSNRSPDKNISSVAKEALEDISSYKNYGRGLKRDPGATEDILTSTENLSKIIKYNWQPDTIIFRCYSDYEMCKTIGYNWTTCGPALWICAVETMIPQVK